ncbi:MAG: aryl-sulfate sulfotransferase [Flavobacteriales bacterium]|nr:aryl-sulfate sulfotransferase [Flavobacteriales bacterium]
MSTRLGKLVGIAAWSLTALCASAQNTVGLLVYDEADMADGYMILYPDLQGTVFLLNACGQVVHSWPDATSVPGNGSRLISNGSILRTYVEDGAGNPFFAAGGAGESVQIKDWDNNILWQYQISSTTECIHHDAEVLPNGNILFIAWELKTVQEAWDAGRDTVGFGYTTLWPDKVMEVQPDGPDGGTVVWEWHAWDHLVQDFNPAASNYGVVAEHPELLDVNFTDVPSIRPDWLHTNSIDYNPILDQIMLSVPFLNEIWIIDHSTTTAEAAGHTGGTSGKGGDFLYRWGNPEAYDHGAPGDQKLFFNHAAVWIGPGLPPNDPDVGKIMVFNNRAQAGISAVDILVPPVDISGQYTYVPGTAYGPLDREQRFATNPGTDLYSPGQGSGQNCPTAMCLLVRARKDGCGNCARTAPSRGPICYR